MVLRRPNRQVEERMLGEYVNERLKGVPVTIHLRVGAPEGMDPTSPTFEMERRLFMSTLPEADVVFRDGEDVVILEFGVWRPQTKIGQLLLYRELLPETPGFIGTPPERIRTRIVVGRQENMVKRMAGLAGVEIEVFSRPWLDEILKQRTGGRQ